MLNKVSPNVNPFFLGLSRFNGTHTYVAKNTKLPYFISKQFSDSNGDFDEPILINISGEDIEHLTLYFDHLNNQYPRNIIVNEKLYNVDTPIFTVGLDTTDEVDIIIDNWSEPNVPFVLRGVV